MPIAEDSIDKYIEYLKNIAKKWSQRWYEDRVYEAEPKEGVPKYFTTAAFMYPNAPAHIGHARTYLIPDIVSRFKRALGYNVLFPMAFHYTGTPILVMAERIASNDEEFINKLVSNFGLPKEVVIKLREPLSLARYFHEVSKEAMKYYGLSIDWRREFTTVDPEFKAFIRWQFKKLRDKGFVTQGSHPVGWCPRHEMPVGMHDTKDDVEPEIEEFTLIKFKLIDNEYVLPAATLRPETVLGVTNMWVNPNEDYCLCNVTTDKGNKETWIIACKAADRLKYQLSIDVVRKFKGEELLGKEVVNPVTGTKVKILPGVFVSPKYGTGVVMSVPAHAPYDYIALADYFGSIDCSNWGELRPIPLIRVEGYGDYPARDVIVKLGAKSQKDRELLDKATKEVYRVELERGVMRHDVTELIISELIPNIKYIVDTEVKGKSVRRARDVIRDVLIKSGYGGKIYELINAPVYCRCGTEVVVKLLRDQWFLDYGNENWKKLAKELLNSMRIIPEEARNQFLAVIDWLKARACARSRGLGTEIPWGRGGWIIESLSDSTIYMAFYTIAHKLRRYRINHTKLTEEFWDYVLLGKGDVTKLSKELGIDVGILEELRREFMYWYPLDSRHSGKDLIPNHLSFFIFNHAAIFPKELWPKQIVANGWVLVRGEKMSKSKGNVRTLMGLIESYSPDAVRLALATTAEVEQDLNFDEEVVLNALTRIADVESLIIKMYNEANADKFELPERWLMSRLCSNVLRIMDDIENIRIRSAGITAFYTMYSDLKKYLILSKGLVSKCVRDYIREWLKVISWFTPFIAEEIWHKLGFKSYIVTEKLINKDELLKYYDPMAELSIQYVDLIIDDIKSIVRVVSGDKVLFCAASKDDYILVKKAVEVINRNGKISDLIRSLKNDVPRLGYMMKDLPLISRQLYEVITKLPSNLREYLSKVSVFDEAKILNELRNYIESRTGLKIVDILSKENVKPVKGRVEGKLVIPLKPAIIIKDND